MSIRLRAIGHVCYEIVLPSGRVLVINPTIDAGYPPEVTTPIKCEEITGADYIAITEDSPGTIVDIGALVKRFNSKVICSHELAEPLAKFFNLDYANIIRVTAGNTIVFDDLNVDVKKSEQHSLLQSARSAYEMVNGKKADPALSREELNKIIPPRVGSQAIKDILARLETAGLGHHRGEHLDFIFRTNENLRIYYSASGAYEFMRHEMTEAHPNVLIVQLGGNDPENVAKLAALSGAEVVILTAHHGVYGPEVKREMERRMKLYMATASKASFIGDLEYGRWYEIKLNLLNT